MKKFIPKKLCLSVMFFLSFGISNTLAQSNSATAKSAAEGDTVWVVVNHVKPDKKAQFERFVYEIFWPSAKKLDSKAQRAFDHTRILNAAGPEEDGTYTYVFLMDPLISGEDYQIENALKKMYPKEEAAEYMRLFKETLARESEVYILTQSKYMKMTTKK